MNAFGFQFMHFHHIYLVVTYKGKKLSLPGVTDIKLNSDLTYVKLDQMLAEAAQDIINKRNTELANRKGGKPSAY